MISAYPACFYREKEGGYSVIFPDLNHLATCGETLDQALIMAVIVWRSGGFRDEHDCAGRRI